jgi:hypothetical protein
LNKDVGNKVLMFDFCYSDYYSSLFKTIGRIEGFCLIELSKQGATGFTDKEIIAVLLIEAAISLFSGAY